MTLKRWGLAEDSLLVEYVARCVLGGREVEWRAADWIAIREGLIAHRVAYFDWVAVLREDLWRPRAAASALRAGLRPRSLHGSEIPW